MAVFSDSKDSASHTYVAEHSPVSPVARKPNLDETTPVRTLRKFQSQPQMNSEKRRRHFSFEPGEDYRKRVPSTNCM